MLDRIEFLLTEAFVALRRNLLMTFAAISTAAVALFLLGGLAYVYLRVNQFATDVTNRFEMRVWLKDSVTEAQAKQMLTPLRQIEGVRTVVLVPKEVEWARWKSSQPEMVRGWENFLSHSFRVTLKQIDDADGVARELAKRPEVEKDGVVYLRDEQRLMDQIMAMLRWVGGALGSLLLVTAGILIFNAIKLTILARRREIRVMQLVGASPGTIRTPFMIEGAFQGALGGVFAAFLIAASQTGIQRIVDQVMVGVTFAAFPVSSALVLLGAIGAVFGAICSGLAIREPLKIRPGGKG